MGLFLPGLWELDEFDSFLIWATELDPLPKNLITKTILCAITHLHHKLGDLKQINTNKPLTNPEEELEEDIKPVISALPLTPAVVIELDDTPAPESKMAPPPVMATATTEAPTPDSNMEHETKILVPLPKVPNVAEKTSVPAAMVDVKMNKPPTSLVNVETKTDKTPALDPTPVTAHNLHKKEKKEETEEELGPWVSLVIKVCQMKFSFIFMC